MSTLKRLLFPALLAAASFATCFLVVLAPARSDGLPTSRAPVTRAAAEEAFPTNPWTSVYIAAGVGTGALTSDFGFGVDGYALSGRAGADVQINRIVLGIVGDYQWDHISAGGFSATPKEWGVAGRAGVLVTNDALLYALAGPRWLEVSGMDTKGLMVGGGMEVAMTKNWRLGLEYQHIDWDAISSAREQTVTGRVILAFPPGGLFR